MLKSERIGKIDPETNQIVPCRPKRKKSEPKPTAEPVAAENSSATRVCTGLSDLFDWAGKSSGMEECVRHSFNAGGDADKILSVARYLVATGDPVNLDISSGLEAPISEAELRIDLIWSP